MTEVQRSLRQQVLRQLEQALSASRAPGVSEEAAKAAELNVRRFCKLLRPLGEAARGAEAFTEYCCEQLRLIVHPAQPPPEPGSPSFQPAAPPPTSPLPVPAQLAQVLQRGAALCNAATEVFGDPADPADPTAAAAGLEEQQALAAAVRATSIDLASEL